jgi:hypothetical protein
MANSGVKSTMNWVIGIASIVLVLLVMLIVFGNLSGNTGIKDVNINIVVTNESHNGLAQGEWINVTGYTLKRVNASNSGYTITQVWNQTHAGDGTGAAGGIVEPDNYTISASGVVTNTTTATPFNNYRNVTISYTYTHTCNSYTEDIAESVITNVSSGVGKLTTQIPTILLFVGIALLLFVLIGVLAWVIKRMSSFGGGGGGGGRGNLE